MRSIAVIVASGKGERLKSDIYKQFIPVNNKPIVAYSIQSFQDSKSIDEIIVVTNKDKITFFKNEIIEKYNFDKVTDVISGGNTRSESVYNALKICKDCKYIFIHDGVRPLITCDMIDELLDNVIKYNAVAYGSRLKGTIWNVDSNDFITSTIDRDSYISIQTPQVFKFDILKNSYDKYILESETLTDDCSVVNKYSDTKIKIINNDNLNLKITTKEDLAIFENIIKN